MFLTNFGKPFPIESVRDNQEDICQDSPILATSIFIPLHKIPSNWTGTMYSSKSIINHIKLHLSDDLKSRATLRPLRELGRYIITLPNKRKVRVIPLRGANNDAIMFICKVKSIRSIITGDLNILLNEFTNFEPLRVVIVCTIDVLYVDDTVFLEKVLDEEEMNMHPDPYRIRIITTLLGPRRVVGLYGSHIPDYITCLCRQTKAIIFKHL